MPLPDMYYVKVIWDDDGYENDEEKATTTSTATSIATTSNGYGSGFTLAVISHKDYKQFENYSCHFDSINDMITAAAGSSRKQWYMMQPQMINKFMIT
jgi:hypothetical protein